MVDLSAGNSGGGLAGPDEEDDFHFKKRVTYLKTAFEEQLKAETRLNTLMGEGLRYEQ